MNFITTHSKGGTCDRCGKGIVNVAVFEHGGERMEVGLDCAYKLTSGDFPTSKAIRLEMKAAREMQAFKRAIAKSHFFVEPVKDNANHRVYWSDAKRGYHAGFSNESLTGLRAEYRDMVLKYAKGDKYCAV